MIWDWINMLIVVSSHNYIITTSKVYYTIRNFKFQIIDIISHKYQLSIWWCLPPWRLTWNIIPWRFGSDHVPFFSWVMAVGSSRSSSRVYLMHLVGLPKPWLKEGKCHLWISLWREPVLTFKDFTVNQCWTSMVFSRYFFKGGSLSTITTNHQGTQAPVRCSWQR